MEQQITELVGIQRAQHFGTDAFQPLDDTGTERITASGGIDDLHLKWRLCDLPR